MKSELILLVILSYVCLSTNRCALHVAMAVCLTIIIAVQWFTLVKGAQSMIAKHSKFLCTVNRELFAVTIVLEQVSKVLFSIVFFGFCAVCS